MDIRAILANQYMDIVEEMTLIYLVILRQINFCMVILMVLWLCLKKGVLGF